MKLTAFSKVVLGLTIVSSGAALFASDVDKLREWAKAMRTKAVRLSEQGNREQAQEMDKESAGRSIPVLVEFS